MSVNSLLEGDVLTCKVLKYYNKANEFRLFTTFLQVITGSVMSCEICFLKCLFCKFSSELSAKK